MQDWVNYDCQEIVLKLMVKCKFISDVLSVDFLSRLFGNLMRKLLFFQLLFVTIIIKKK